MTTAAERYLVFDLSGSRYALPLKDVAEVLEQVPTFPIPRATAPILGAINFHGRIVAVLDLSAFLQSGGFPPDGKYIVLDREQTGLAIACGPTVNIIPAEVVLEEEPPDAPFVERLFVLADGEVRLLHLEDLILHLEELLHG